MNLKSGREVDTDSLGLDTIDDDIGTLVIAYAYEAAGLTDIRSDGVEVWTDEVVGDNSAPPVTADERAELAAYMVARWQAWGARGAK